MSDIILNIEAQIGDLKKNLKEAQGEIEKLKQKAEEGKKGIEKSGSGMDKTFERIAGGVKNTIIGMVGVTAAIKTFQSVIESTSTSADWWKKSITGVQFGLDYLKRAIAGLGMTDMNMTMGDAVRLGREYAQALDDLGDRMVALKIRDSAARVQIVELMKAMRDQTKTAAERANAAKKIVEIEKANAADMIELTKQEMNVKLDAAAKIIGTDKDRLKEYLTNRDKYMDAAKPLIDLQTEIKDAEEATALMRTQTGIPGITLGNKVTREMKEVTEDLRKEMETATEEQKFAYEMENKLNQLRESDGTMSIDALVQAMTAYDQALIQADERTMRTQGLLTGFYDTQRTEAEKMKNDVVKSQLEAAMAIGDGMRVAMLQEQKTYEANKVAYKNNRKALENEEVRHQAELEKIRREGLKQMIDDFVAESEYIDAKIQMYNESIKGIYTTLAESSMDYDSLIAESEDKAAMKAEEKELLRQEAIRTTQGVLTASLDVISNKQQEAMDAELARIDQLTISEEEKEKKKEEVRLKYAKKGKGIAIVQAIIDTAAAIVNQLTAKPAGIQNFILAAAAAVMGAAQVAVIASQKFAKGGYRILGGRLHQDGGVMTPIGEAERDEGIAIFSREATHKYRKVIPELVDAINKGVFPDVDMKAIEKATGAHRLLLKHHVSLDDSRQLEDIKQLLSMAHVEYTTDKAGNRYRIHRQKGLTIKTKLS